MNEWEELQTRLTFQEDALQELTLTVVRQENDLAFLRQELAKLRVLIRTGAGEQPARWAGG